MYVHYYSFLSAYVDLLLSCKQTPMLIIWCLQMHFYWAPLLSCRLEGLELSVSSPWSSRKTQYQLSGSAALIIIWPHLFGGLWESWFPSCTLRASVHSASFPFLKVILWQASSKAASSDAALDWGHVSFPTNHCQLTLKAGNGWHLCFHYRPSIKNTHPNTQQQCV